MVFLTKSELNFPQQSQKENKYFGKSVTGRITGCQWVHSCKNVLQCKGSVYINTEHKDTS